MSQRSFSSQKGFDWITLCIYLALVLIGWLMLYATVYDERSTELFSLSSPATKQGIWIGISLFAMVCVLALDWKVWSTFAYPIFGLSLVLLIAVVIFGPEIKGARSWFSFGGFSFQPSEFAKLGASLALSAYLSSYKTNIKGGGTDQFVAIGLMILPAMLIMLQPDAGSALVFMSLSMVLYKNGLSPFYFVIAFSFILVFVFSLIFNPWIVAFVTILIAITIFLLNLDRRRLWMAVLTMVTLSSAYCYSLGFLKSTALGLLAFLGLSTVALYQARKMSISYLVLPSVVVLSAFSFGASYAFENVLERHQQERINVWLRPSLCDPQGSLYNIIQSKMAIGSGGFQGKGFLEGTMTKLNYVPEQTTDFIFSTVGEEQGFMGSISVVILFTLLLFRITFIAERAKNQFIANYAYCLAGIIFIHFFINIGMTLGIMPVIGIPLPFLSKGGSSLLIFSIMMGILLRMDRARYRI